MATAASPRLRSIALPAEHGSWGLTLEPILLGLLVAPSWGGVGLAIGAFGLFLLRWPLKVAQTSRKQKRYARMRMALRFAGIYALLAAGGLLLGVWQAGWRPLLPLLPALPFGLIFFLYDTQNRSRSWQAELAGPVAFAATATSIALAGGCGCAGAGVVGGVGGAGGPVRFIRARPVEAGSRQALSSGAGFGCALNGFGGCRWVDLACVAATAHVRGVWAAAWSGHRRIVSLSTACAG